MELTDIIVGAATSIFLFLMTVLVALFAWIANRLVKQMDSLQSAVIKQGTLLDVMSIRMENHFGEHMLKGEKLDKAELDDDP